MQIIATVSFDELNTKSSIEIEGTNYKVLKEFRLLCAENGNLLKYDKSGRISKKTVFKDPYGYEFISFEGNYYFVHRLVALAYGLLTEYKYSPDKEVDHMNDVRDDNCICNLQILTKPENLAKRKKTSNKKITLTKDNEVYSFDSKTECAQWLIDNKYSKGSLQHTRENLARTRLTHYGFKYNES